jgi:hypothetical protein
MATRRLFDGAAIELGQVPIVGTSVIGTIAWINVSGVWKQAIAYVKIAGVWKTATLYVNVTGVWK